MKRAFECGSDMCTKHRGAGGPIARLNIGGKIFDTTPDTLAGCPYFKQFLSGKELGHRFDEDGRLFVDRNGDLFSHILEYLRSRRRPPQHIIDGQKNALLAECAFYCMDELIGNIHGELSVLDLRRQDKTLRDEEQKAMCSLSRGTSNLLLDIHNVDRTPLPKEALQLPLLFTRKYVQPEINGGFAHFVQQLDMFSGGLVSSLKGNRHIVFAGGAVLGALTGTSAGDIDIFLTAPPAEALAILKQIMLSVQRNQALTSGNKSRILVTRSRNAVTFYRVCSSGGSPSLSAPPVQVILTLNTCIMDLLGRFDVDCCCVAWAAEDDKVVCTPRGLRALRPAVAIAAMIPCYGHTTAVAVVVSVAVVIAAAASINVSTANSVAVL
jgi:hypothetical protein